MTTKIYCYSLTGKTEALLEGYDYIRLNNIPPTEFNFGEERTIILGTPTYGRGVPPKYFKDILPQLRSLKGRRIGLFGSGNTIYGEYYCGALDVFEVLLSKNNTVLFKYKFEGYPTVKVKEDFKEIMKDI